jgi:hypothetical protein
MKQKRFLIFLFLASCFIANADEPPRHSFVAFVHGGYGYLPDGAVGLTNASDSYDKTLSSGGSWDVQFFYKHKALITGLLYSGYTSSGELTYSSDRIFTNYLAPQAGMLFPIYNKFSFSFNAGMGCMWYLNKSIVYEKDRRVTGRGFAMNLGIRGIYDISKHVGLSLEYMTTGAALGKTKVNYHDENTIVKNRELFFNLNQYMLSLGLKYSF